MNKILKRFLIVGLVALVGIQFIPADVNKQEGIPATDIRYVYKVPDNVMNILETSCYDCHSNFTNYPWYSQVQPFRLIMDYHIKEGQEELNFSEFGNYSERRKRNKLRAITEQVRERKMPLSSYLLLHPEAVLSKKQIGELNDLF
ncbi:MAG: hypothetical protein CL840_18780 [Crocinitomicaceae bacterium]|nr:hypothetical protein [Crocinitomicaceae bacterium]|tara:strand:+ start:10302 stop:10736 length:435 start_codon:yes stop_codon:yes gene_type:complete